MPASEALPLQDEKRDRILDAAHAVCLRRGFDAVRMEEVAAEARVSKGTLYRFFQSREELLVAAVLRQYEQGSELVYEEGPAADDPRSRLVALTGGLARALPSISSRMAVSFQMWGVLAREAAARDLVFPALREIYTRRADELREILGDGLAAGVFRGGLDVQAFVDAILATFDGFVYRSTFDPERAGAKQLGATLEELVRSITAEDRV